MRYDKNLGNVLKRLDSEIQNKITLAAHDDITGSRDRILASLFEDLIGPLEEDVKSLLGTEIYDLMSSKMIDNDEEVEMVYYELLAAYYLQKDNSELNNLLKDFRKCMGSPSLAPIVSLLLHRKILELPTTLDSYTYVWLLNILLDGTQALLWIDLNSCSKRFESLFRELQREISVVQSEKEQKSPFQDQIDNLIWAFMLVYNTPVQFLKSLKEKPTSIRPCLQVMARHLIEINIESVLVNYLHGCMSLGEISNWSSLAGPLTTLRFQRSLYLLSQPGGPYYPPASVRKAAFKCLNSLFPQGKFLRTIFASAFRLSYPYYNISAFSNVLIATVRLLVVHIRHAWQRFMFLCSDFFDTLYKIVNENLKVKSFLDILYRKKGQT